uniref:Uncharacterized protein n=1 Tax=Dromedary stool-associated circular ssDNA virus TaxID=1574422 RepID=A0A0A1EKU2_9VIRU|nr:hypothetical protein [Dromedary stool-associated circular ssDNA virus]
MSQIRWWKHISAIIRRYHVPRSYAERIAKYPQYAKNIIDEYRREKRRTYYREKQLYQEAVKNLKLTRIEEEQKERKKKVMRQIRLNRIKAIKRRLEFTDDPQEYKRLKTLEFVYDNELDKGYFYYDENKHQTIAWDNETKEIIVYPD